MTAMPLFLSSKPAPLKWGKAALLSSQNKGITIHYQEPQRLVMLQQAGRQLDSQGIKSIRFLGKGWDLEATWHFWQGFRNPKRNNVAEWPELEKTDLQELQNRLQIIDWVRDTINMPADELSPVELAQRAVTLISSFTNNIEYKLMYGKELNDKGYAGIYTVGRGSSRPPAMLVLDYNPTDRARAATHACLVGKGITFDSGGYSLKPTEFMENMKADMGGAALAAGALTFAISQGLNKHVKLILCCADNLVDGNAFKLGDIIRYRNGKTVEIRNTDAEGRLVLADGLIEAEYSKPHLLIDCATLTGAAKAAVGNDYHSVLSFDHALAEKVLQCAIREKELFWRLPLAEFHRKQLPSAFADLDNTGKANTAGASVAAAFLSYFVPNYLKNWVHIDCSATYRKSAGELWATGATGVGVRTLSRLLLDD